MAGRRIERPKEIVRDFREFARDYNVAPLAIGVVIGTSVNDFVKTLVNGFFTPLISLLAPRQGIQNFTVTIRGSVFAVGAVANSLISFLIVLWIVYIAVKVLLRQKKEEPAKE